MSDPKQESNGAISEPPNPDDAPSEVANVGETPVAAPEAVEHPLTEEGRRRHGVPARTPPRRRQDPELEVVSWVGKKKKSRFGVFGNWLFILTVLIPTALSVAYFGYIASDVFISESRFVVRTPQRTQAPSIMGALLQGGNFMRAQDDAFTVHDFIDSRDALKELEKKHGLRASFTSEKVDPINRFPGPLGDESFESFYKYYTKHVVVEYDAASSITTLRVRAYTAKDALDINSTLLALGENLVNQINDRGRQDLVQYAMTEVVDAQNKAKAAALAVAAYRNQREVFDPERQSAQQLLQIGRLQDELISTKMQLAQIVALSPLNPQIPVLEKRAKGLEENMANEMSKVASSGGNSFSNKAAEFERLTLERGFAERQVASALASLESARNEARRKQLYLERIVQPNLPDYAIEPRRLRNILATFLLGLIAWGIASMLLSGVREHQA